MIEIRKPYGDRDRVQVQFLDDEGNHDGRTEQHHKDACCVQKIISQYDRTGVLQHVARAKAFYGDYTEVNEFQESLNLVMRAQDDFDALPSHIRKRFANDPGEFFEFVTNPDNHDECVKLGLAEPRSAPIKPKEKDIESDAPAAD